MHMENRGSGDYTLPLNYDEIKTMAAGEGMGIKFTGYTDAEPDEFMQDLAQTMAKIENKIVIIKILRTGYTPVLFSL